MNTTTPRVFTRTRWPSSDTSLSESTPAPSPAGMDLESSSASLDRWTEGARSRAEMREPPLMRDVVMVSSFQWQVGHFTEQTQTGVRKADSHLRAPL